MYGIQVNIGRMGVAKWRWVNDPSTSRPYRATTFDEAWAQKVRWFRMSPLYWIEGVYGED